jgi:hypothetical protein
MDDPVAPARDFITAYGASWPTIDDPSGAIKAAYRVAARPQSYFIDAAGVLRTIQVGEVTDAEFEHLYASIAPNPAPGSSASAPGSSASAPGGSTPAAQASTTAP